ncbi:uncharacterized protein N7458_012483 [Penicillium daleae]|uniref:Malic acid transport protein n=1 Tax=Penicillium daleae TaxID=63821 RepID=A0AAD6BUV8_9EURO|nr:uncharacterized protein N7458_012483 [Penicillium daleae]KAJ5433327.1 hypothetical protein N7458_012483 [Penicillium daleae]
MSPDHHGPKNGARQDSELETGVNRPPTSPVSRALWNFSSQWFLVPQGTGIISLILHQLDYQFRGLAIISVIAWIYTIALLTAGVSLYLLRVLMYPRHVAHALRTSMIETACLASISITFTLIIQMIVLVLVRQWGSAWGIVAYVLWWINTAMAVISVMGIPYFFVKVQSPGVKAVTPCVLLPLIAAPTSAAGGGVICRYALSVTVYKFPSLLSLTLKSFPPLEQIYQDMILCGPFGQGSFALQALGQAVLRGSFAGYDQGTFLTAEAAKPIAFTSQFAGLLAWGYGTFWWIFAIISIIHTCISQPGGIRHSHFTLSAWALVFPMGVYTNAAVQLGKIMDSPAFKVWSTVLLLLLVIIWAVNHIFTIKGMNTGEIWGTRWTD